MNPTGTGTNNTVTKIPRITTGLDHKTDTKGDRIIDQQHITSLFLFKMLVY